MQKNWGNLIIFGIEKMHKFAFFLLFLLKIGILHFCEQIENKGGLSTLNRLFVIGIGYGITYKKIWEIQLL